MKIYESIYTMGTVGCETNLIQKEDSIRIIIIKFIKILHNYLDDVRSLNYASFIEWLNPKIPQ
jgi:hypothetical protein